MKTVSGGLRWHDLVDYYTEKPTPVADRYGPEPIITP